MSKKYLDLLNLPGYQLKSHPLKWDVRARVSFFATPNLTVLAFFQNVTNKIPPPKGEGILLA